MGKLLSNIRASLAVQPPRPPRAGKLTANEAALLPLFREIANHVVGTRTNNRSLLPRSAYMNRGGTTTQARTLDQIAEACGYVHNPGPDDLRDLFDVSGVASRVVSVHSDETWTTPPAVFETENRNETEFEVAFADLEARVNLFFNLSVADEISGIGRYGALFLGFNDRKDPVAPLKPSPGNDLVYVQPLDEQCARITAWDTDKLSPRCGMPTEYEVQFALSADLTGTSMGILGETSLDVSKYRVHWTRMLHVAETRHGSRAFAVPKLQKVYPQCHAIMKIGGGSGEMFWGGGFPGLALEALPGPSGEFGEFDRDSVSGEMQKYIDRFQRWIGIDGASVKTLSTNIADPTAHLTAQLLLVCASIQVPMKIFLGTEAGHLASTQDTTRWNGRIAKRRSNYVNPRLLYPLVNHLVAMRALPKPKNKRGCSIEWTDLNSPTDKDRADYGLKVTQSLLQYVTSGAEKVMPLYQYLTMVLRFSHSESTAIIKLVASNPKVFTKELWTQQGGGTTPATSGTRPTKRTGASGKRNGLGK